MKLFLGAWYLPQSDPLLGAKFDSTCSTRGRSRLKKSSVSCSRYSLFFFVFLFVLLRIKVSSSCKENSLGLFALRKTPWHICKYNDVISFFLHDHIDLTLVNIVMSDPIRTKCWIPCIKRARWRSLWISGKRNNIMPSEIFKFSMLLKYSNASKHERQGTYNIIQKQTNFLKKKICVRYQNVFFSSIFSEWWRSLLALKLPANTDKFLYWAWWYIDKNCN